MMEREFTDIGAEEFVLVDGKIFVKFARIFELIDGTDSLESLEVLLGADLNYVVATYLEEK